MSLSMQEDAESLGTVRIEIQDERWRCEQNCIPMVRGSHFEREILIVSQIPEVEDGRCWAKEEPEVREEAQGWQNGATRRALLH